MQLSLKTVHFHSCYSEFRYSEKTVIVNKFQPQRYIIESVDSISRDERGFPLTQYITNGRISRARYTITHFDHDHLVLRLISNRMSI